MNDCCPTCHGLRHRTQCDGTRYRERQDRNRVPVMPTDRYHGRADWYAVERRGQRSEQR